jgi:hypothetical protein
LLLGFLSRPQSSQALRFPLISPLPLALLPILNLQQTQVVTTMQLYLKQQPQLTCSWPVANKHQA